MQASDPLARASALREISNAMAGGALQDAASPEVRAAAETMSSLTVLSDWGRLAAGLLLAGVGFLWGASRLRPDFRARHGVERAVIWVLMACRCSADHHWDRILGAV
jgi:phosphate transport system permease protein